MTKSAALGLLSLALVAAGVATYVWQGDGRGRSTVLRRPFIFREGQSFSQVFDVDLPATYFLLIEFTDAGLRPEFDLQRPVPPDNFEIQFNLTDNGMTVAQGSSLDEGQGVSYGPKITFRYIARFNCQTGRQYRLEFRVTRASTQLRSVHAVANVVIDPAIEEHAPAKRLLRIMSYVLAALAIVFATAAFRTLGQARRRVSNV